MRHLIVLAAILAAPLPVAAAQSSVKIETTVVKPRVIAGVRRPVRAHVVRRTRAVLPKRTVVAHHVPRPLSPGEFGRAKASF